MVISVIGGGYDGLTTSSVLAEFGHQVNFFDKDQRKVELLNKGEISIIDCRRCLSSDYAKEQGLNVIGVAR